MKQELGSLKVCGAIEKCDGLWESTLLLVRKEYGGVRLCVDYRQLNISLSETDKLCTNRVFVFRSVH